MLAQLVPSWLVVSLGRVRNSLSKRDGSRRRAFKRQRSTLLLGQAILPECHPGVKGQPQAPAAENPTESSLPKWAVSLLPFSCFRLVSYHNNNKNNKHADFGNVSDPNSPLILYQNGKPVYVCARARTRPCVCVYTCVHANKE